LDDQQKQHIIDPAKIAAGGVAAPLAALLTSRFGVAGTMVGLAISAVVATTVSDILKTYLQRAPGTVKNMPGSARARFSLKNVRRMVTAPFSWFLSLSPSRRRAMLISSIVAGVIAFLIGASAVTALEVGAGKNLSCWVWNECSTESSTGEGTSSTSTLPSILGGGQDVVSSSTLQKEQQPTADSQSASSQPSGTPTAKAPGSLQSGRQTPSGAPEEQQQNSPTRVVEEQQQSSSGVTGEQQSSSSTKVTEEQQQNPPSVPDSGVGSPQDNSDTQPK
jgi:hypothetical protein